MIRAPAPRPANAPRSCQNPGDDSMCISSSRIAGYQVLQPSPLRFHVGFAAWTILLTVSRRSRVIIPLFHQKTELRRSILVDVMSSAGG